MTNRKKAKTESQTLSGVAQPVSLKDLGESVPKKMASEQDFAIWIRVLMQNWRQGTVGCKERSDVARTGKKPWKQKGTGRARAGTARSPLWRGGGVTFGPQARDKTLHLSKKRRKLVLANLLKAYVENSKVIMLDWELETAQPKTAAAFSALKDAGLSDRKMVLFLPTNDQLTFASFVNIPLVRILFFDQANAFDLAKSDYWVFLKKDFNFFKEMVSKWS